LENWRILICFGFRDSDFGFNKKFMAKNIKAKLKLQIPAGEATPAPPLGPVLAGHGVNIGAFINQFNEATKDKKGEVLPIELTIYEDRSFDFVLRKPLASALLKKAAGVEKGSGEPNRSKVGSITREQLKALAQEKMADLNAEDIEGAMKILEGTAGSMGIEIKG
jgi:large subunit ribosomal protein L11